MSIVLQIVRNFIHQNAAAAEELGRNAGVLMQFRLKELHFFRVRTNLPERYVRMFGSIPFGFLLHIPVMHGIDHHSDRLFQDRTG